MEIVWRQTALNGLENARRYIAKRNPIAATRMFNAILTATERLAVMPHLGRPGRVTGTRELVVPRTPYIVAYTVIDERIDILAVQHGAQDWPSEFFRPAG
jgi:addiction module RelE/StbE family toxin